MKSDFVPTVNPAQCRMARAGLDWSVRELATQSGIHVNTVVRFEKGRETLHSTAIRMRETLERAGVVFLDDNGQGLGVRVRELRDGAE